MTYYNNITIKQEGRGDRIKFGFGGRQLIIASVTSNSNIRRVSLGILSYLWGKSLKSM